MKAPIFFLLLLLHSQCWCIDITYYVKEEQSPGTYLGDIGADSNLLATLPPEEHSMVRFSLIQQRLAPVPALFRLSKKTGKLFTAQPIDAESLCAFNTDCFQILTIAARGAGYFMKILKIKIVIQDINDNEPTFPEKEIQIQFSEADGPGIKRMIPNSIDNDVDRLNSQVSYQLKKNPNDPFSLVMEKSVDGISDLSIILEDVLDHEARDSYEVQLIAKDGGTPPKESVLKVHILVKDINDNPPLFTKNIYNVSIRYEHSKSTPIVVLSATDADGEKNSQISYQLSPKTSSRALNHFKLNEVTGEVFLLKNFEPGQNPAYKLFVRATDNGVPTLSAIATVLVNIINQQNTAPRIDISFVSDFFRNTASISEDIKIGSFIAYVMVTDNDVGKNGEVSCSLDHQKFQLQSLGMKEYKITIKEELDREVVDHYEVAVDCWDNATPPLLGQKKFAIKLMDINDVSPILPKDAYMFWIYENLKPRFPVGNIPATDPDMGNNGKLSYSLEHDSKEKFLPFEISSNGFISTIISMDYEYQDVYNFDVVVRDNGIPRLSSTANVTVQVRDENDNPPYFTYPSVNPFTLAVEYYPHRSKNITFLKAFDLDSRENAFLKFEIHSGNAHQLFAVSPYTGVLTFAKEATRHDSGNHPLVLIVKDSGSPMLSSTTRLILNLTVTNRTSAIQNAVLTKTDEKIHVNVLISILVISVLLSVPVTASLSFCFMRLKERRDAQRQNKMTPPCKCSHDHGHYMCPSHETTYWSNGSKKPSNDASTNTLLTKSKKGIYSTDDSKKKAKDTTSDDIYQEIGDTCTDEKMEEKQFMSLDYNTDGWIDEDSKGITDLYPCHNYYEPRSTHNGQLPANLKKGGSSQQGVTAPKSTPTVSRSMYKVNIGHIPDCSVWSALPDVSEEDDSYNQIYDIGRPLSPIRNKPATPARNKPPTPARNKLPTPVQNKPPTPERNKVPTAFQNKPPTPERNKVPTSVQNKPPTPERNKVSTSVQTKPPTPERNKVPTSVQNKPPTPERNKVPTSLQNKPPTPERNKLPTPNQCKAPTQVRNKPPTPLRKLPPIPTVPPACKS